MPFEVVDRPITEKEVVAGELPKIGERTLIVDFEPGTLEDWTVTGEAFADVVISDDASQIHEPDMQINPSGKYFVSSGGTVNHKLVGTLTFVPFKVTHPFASFKVSGGALQDTRVELVSADENKVFFHITGSGRATLQPVVVDLKEHLRKNIFIRLIDNERGDIEFISR